MTPNPIGPIRSGLTPQGRDDSPCKRCEFCHTRNYGCLDARCYCHTHDMEPKTMNGEKR